MTSSTIAGASPAVRVKLFPLVVTAITFAWLADFLFWNHPPGVSVGIFAVALAAAMLAGSARDRARGGVWLATALLFGACVQTGIELCFTNILVLLVLLAVIGGSTYYADLPRGWPRWLEQ